MSRIGALLAIAALLTSCTDAPKDRFFTLTTVPPAKAAPPRRGDPPSIASVRLPGAVDRRPLVVRTGPVTVEVRDNEQWAEPLETMAARVLAQDLALRTPAAARPEATGHARQVAVQIDDIMGDSAGVARLSGWWSSDAAAAKSPRHDFAMTTSFDAGDDTQMVAALSRLLGMLADRIAASQ